jgi:hypothetical protein
MAVGFRTVTSPKTRARALGISLGAIICTVAFVAALWAHFGPNIPSNVIAFAIALWLATLVIRLALTVSTPHTPGEMVLGKLTLWPGAIMSAVGIGFFIEKYAAENWNTYLVVLIVTFSAACLIAVVIVRVQDRRSDNTVEVAGS